MKSFFALSLFSVLLILSCGKSGSDFELEKGTPAYELANQLSQTIPYLDPEKNNVLVSTNKFEFTTGEVIYDMQKNMGNRSNQLTNLDENQLRDNINRFANYLGERKLLLAEAKKENISTSEAQIDSVLKLHFQRTGGEEKFLKLLDKNGQSIEDVKNDVGMDQTIQKYINDVIIAGIKINEDDIKKEYEEDKTATVRHILLSTKGKSESEKKAIKEKMENILAQAKNGKDFAELAKQYSEDPGSKANGGLYKDIRRGQMAKPFEDAAFSTPIGEISDVFETSYGFHILTVLERKKETRPFEEVRKTLENKMKQQKKREAFQQRLSDLKTQYEYKVIQF